MKKYLSIFFISLVGCVSNSPDAEMCTQYNEAQNKLESDHVSDAIKSLQKCISIKTINKNTKSHTRELCQYSLAELLITRCAEKDNQCDYRLALKLSEDLVSKNENDETSILFTKLIADVYAVSGDYVSANKYMEITNEKISNNHSSWERQYSTFLECGK